jgi:hypothetical protein
MTNRSTLKGLITKLKNKIINSLHEAELEKLIKIAELLNIKISPEIKKYTSKKADEKSSNPD